MSTETTSHTDDSDDRDLKEICESIADDDEYSDDVQHIADGLLDAIKSGDLDAN